VLSIGTSPRSTEQTKRLNAMVRSETLHRGFPANLG
jgi:hypothetical protein